MDLEFNQRVKKLADTLKARGIAPSDSAAQTMAEDIVRTEMRQSKMLEERRDKPEFNPQQRKPQPAPQPQPQQAPTPEPRPQAPATSADSPSRAQDSLDTQAAQRIAGEYGIDTDKPISELLKDGDEPTYQSQTSPQQPEQAPPQAQPQQPEQPQQPPTQQAQPQQESEEKKEKSPHEKIDLSEMFNFSKR